MKVDLADMERRVATDIEWNGEGEFMTDVIALIRVARAAKDCEACTSDAERTHAWAHLRAALSDIEDSR